MSTLAAKGVEKRYGKKSVLQDINLTLESGKIYGLIGRNGAGKTTLLSALTAQRPVTEGTVTVDGMPVWENPAALSRVSLIKAPTQMMNGTANTMKVKEFLEIAAAFLPGWDKALADRLVQEFGIERKKKIGKLSTGMCSMLGIVVALAGKVEFTLLDEPTSGLDVVAREKFYRLLLEEFTESGRTFLISTHIIEEVSDLFEEVIFLNEGKILLKENTVDLLERSFRITGHENAVDSATAGLAVYHKEQLGRSKTVTVLTKDAAEADALQARGQELTVQKPGLQQLFVALCGEEQV